MNNNQTNVMKKYSLLSLLLLLSLFSPYYVAAAENHVLGPEEWPVTVEHAVDGILLSMSEEDKQAVKGTPKANLSKYHHGLGTRIRNRYGLWRGNTELLNAACGQPCHADDASMIIVQTVWERLQK